MLTEWWSGGQAMYPLMEFIMSSHVRVISGASKHSHFLCGTAVLYQILSYMNVVFTKV